MRSTTLRLLLLLLAMAVLGGCVSLPDAGIVTTQPGQEPVQQGDGSFDYTPSGPRRGSPPLEIVQDWLLSMQASPQSTAVARKFLTVEAQPGWRPQQGTLIYSSKLVGGKRDNVDVSLVGTVQLDERGTWLGTTGGAGGRKYRLRLVRERGQWRIANPPDALLIPRSHFETRYQQFFVYFFDPTARVLVPEPTYLPRGEQAATLLVRRLLRGPAPSQKGVLRSFIPGGTEYVLSVPVSSDGVAQVELSEQLLQLRADDRQMALAQLAWTLRQVTGVESMRVTVGGSPIDIPGAGSPQSVKSWAEFDPSIHWASQELFGIRDKKVVAVGAEGGEVVGRFGAQDYALRDIAVDLEAENVAGVTDDGTTVVVAPRGGAGGKPPDPGQTKVVYSGGTDVLRPAWDVFDELWVVDNTRRGTTVSIVKNGAVSRVDAPGLEDQDVSRFVVSRDGTRLVAVVKGRTGDHLVISRVLRTEAGKVRALTPAVGLPLAQGGVDEIRDLAWRGPGSLAVLTGPTRDSSQVLLALVDGSTALPGVDSTAEIFRGRTVRLVASPSPGTPLFLGSPQGSLFELGSDGQWTEASMGGPMLAPTFVG
ncbi:MAG TPA: LpqB family beta-propeller domain-containing protein [Nocardioidaceae bacterium]|nr:LpqB family beta-propeller domain-containing protein [Nocardioidaceae bacterium]